MVPIDLMREEVSVQTNELNRSLTAAEAANAFQEGVIRVPVRQEEAVVAKEAVVTGEVVVNKTQTSERQQITDTVRRVRVDVDNNYTQYRNRYEQQFQANQGQYASTSFSEAEPNFQVGYTAARDARNKGRKFNEVESDIRSTYYGDSSNDEWKRLREEVHTAYDDVQNG